MTAKRGDRERVLGESYERVLEGDREKQRPEGVTAGGVRKRRELGLRKRNEARGERLGLRA